MNETEFDHRLHQWLRGGPSSASPRVLAAVVDHVRTRRPDGDLRSRVRNVAEAIAAHRPAPIVLRPIVLLALLALAFAVGVFAYGRWQEINRVVTPVPSPAPTAPPISPQPTSLVQTSFVCPPGTQPDRPGPADQLRPIGRTPNDGTAAVDRQSGVLVYPTDSTLWLFDLCSNTWRTSEAIWAGSAPGLAVYDADSDRIVVFGSQALWVYDADTDTARQLPALVGYAKTAVYDPVSGLIFVLSDDGTGRLSTYDVDRDTWQAVDSSGDIPRVTSAVLMAYDTSVQRIVLYQGMGWDTSTATYEFDPQTSRWTRQAIVTPSMVFIWGDIVRGGEIAYDEARARTIVFSRGKLIAYDASLHDWETVFDSPMDAVWPASGSNDPTHRQEAALAYDPVHQRTLAIGGSRFTATGDWVVADDVIAFDLGTRSWMELLGPSADIPVWPTPSPEAGCPIGANPDQPGPADQLRPPAGALGPVAFDRQAGKVVAFSDAGGEAALWAFDVCTNTWSRSSAQVPTVGAMVYDEAVGQILLVGNTDLLTYDAQADATAVDARLPSTLWSRPVGAVYRSWSDQLIVRNEDASPLPGHSQLWACSRPPSATCYELPESGDVPRPGGSQQLLAYDRSVDALVLYLDRQGIFEAYEYSFQTSVWTRQAEQPPAVRLDAGWIPWDARWDIAYDEEHALSVILGNARLVTFDGATWHWQVVIDAADAPSEARRVPAATVYDPLNRRVLAIAGLRYAEPTTVATDDILAFDLEDNSWVTLLEASSVP